MLNTGFRLALALAILLSLFFVSLTARASESDEPLTWQRLSIPAQGTAGDWVLASGSDVPLLALAGDGTLYAGVRGLARTLYKSADGGYKWQPAGTVSDNIVAIVTAPDEAMRVYYATTSGVYRSIDGGDTFIRLPTPGGAGSGNVEITALAVGGNPLVLAVATRDTDSGQFGGVYSVEDSSPISWTDTGLSGDDIYAVAFSPGFPENRELVAVATDETDTFVATRIGNSAWGASIASARLDRDNSPVPSPVAVTNSAAVAFPEDGASGDGFGLSPLFVAINAGGNQGDVYRVDRAALPGDSRATDLNAGKNYGFTNLDVTSIGVSGQSDNAALLAGAANSARIYASQDGGKEWRRASRAPTGERATRVVLAPVFATSQVAYTATSGVESAVSRTADGGFTWDQTGLIDTTIPSIVDLGVSPAYENDGIVFLLTFGGRHSLWRRDSSARWQRVFASTLPGVDSLSGIRLSPNFGKGDHTMFLTGASSGNTTIWRSKDEGQSFERARATLDPATGTSFVIDAWVVAPNDRLLVAGLVGTAKLYRSDDGGLSYSNGISVGPNRIKSIAVSPGYPGDKTILLGDAAGWVYLSRDDGKTFQPLPADAAAAPLVGTLSVAFAPDFEKSGVVYAASATADKGISRFKIGYDYKWQRVDSTLPAGSSISKIGLSPGGVLYAANLKTGGGMERSLNPDSSLGPGFETVTRGLETTAKLDGLQLAGGRIWSVDSANKWVVFYPDTLAVPPVLKSPDDKAQGLGIVSSDQITGVSLDWAALEGASEYRWQIVDSDTSFASVPAAFDGTTGSSQVRLPKLEPATEYHWRVRVTSPGLGLWSEKRSFTTAPGASAAAPKLLYPQAGEQQVVLRPVFQWEEVSGSPAYELVVSDEAAFDNAVLLMAGTTAINATAWQPDIEFAPGKIYYWRVKTAGDNTTGLWSATRAFTTALALVPSQTVPVVTPPPSPLPAQTVSPVSPPSQTPIGAESPPVKEPTPPPAAPSPTNNPDWTKLIIFFGSALLVVAVVGVAALIVLTRKIGRVGRY